MTTIIIPPKDTSISSYSKRNLSFVNISEGATEIASKSFYNVSGLIKLNLPRVSLLLEVLLNLNVTIRCQLI